jgi:hypothetical protein
MLRDQDHIDKEKQDTKKSGCSIPLTGCAYTIFVIALAAFMMKECQRADLRLKRDKANYEHYMDSVHGGRK